jgi:hypothetical protein
MSVNQDFKDLFNIFNLEAVEYIIVGAHAAIFFSEPRYTKDIDIWINPTRENAEKTRKALEIFGAPLENISVDDFTNRDLVYQIGIEPNRIDILMDIAGVNFSEAQLRAVKSTYGGISVNILSRADLILSKRTVGRKQDLLDIERLENNQDDIFPRNKTES